MSISHLAGWLWDPSCDTSFYTWEQRLPTYRRGWSLATMAQPSFSPRSPGPAPMASSNPRRCCPGPHPLHPSPRQHCPHWVTLFPTAYFTLRTVLFLRPGSALLSPASPMSAQLGLNWPRLAAWTRLLASQLTQLVHMAWT